MRDVFPTIGCLPTKDQGKSSALGRGSDCSSVCPQGFRELIGSNPFILVKDYAHDLIEACANSFAGAWYCEKWFPLSDSWRTVCMMSHFWMVDHIDRYGLGNIFLYTMWTLINSEMASMVKFTDWDGCGPFREILCGGHHVFIFLSNSFFERLIISIL